MEAKESARQLGQLKTQALSNSRHDRDPANGARWKIVAGKVDDIIASKVMGNLQKPPKNNQPPQY